MSDAKACERCGAEQPECKLYGQTVCVDCARRYFVGPGGEVEIARERRAFWERRYEYWVGVEDAASVAVGGFLAMKPGHQADFALGEWDKRFNPPEASK